MSSWGVHKKRDTKRIALTNESPMHTKYFIPVTQNSSVICAIALDEDPYIDEWIQYHLRNNDVINTDAWDRYRS